WGPGRFEATLNRRRRDLKTRRESNFPCLKTHRSRPQTWSVKHQRNYFGGPNGIRTRVSALRGPCPGPLDDGAGQTRDEWVGEEGSNPHYRGQNPASYH